MATPGQTTSQTNRVTVVDFDFCINVAQRLVAGAVQWSVADEEPVYRGHMVHEIGLPGALRNADSTEVKRAKVERELRSQEGLPPWVRANPAAFNRGNREQSGSHDVLKSSWTVRQWADDYCASPNVLKEFVYEKVSRSLPCDSGYSPHQHVDRLYMGGTWKH